MSGQVFIVRTGPFDDALAKALRAAKDLRPAYREIRKPFREDQREHAKKAEGPDGSWAPLAQSTLARRARDAKAKRHAAGGKTGRAKRARRRRRTLKQRRVLGRLPTMLDVRITRMSLIATSKVPWGDAHFSGATVGKGVKLPARPFLYVSDALEQKVVEIFQAHVLKGFDS